VFGEIERRLEVSPKLIRVGAEDAAGRSEPRRIKLRVPKGYSMTVTKSEVMRPDWFELKEEIHPGEGIDFLLSVKPDPTRRGPVDTYVRFFVTVSGKGLPPVEYEEPVMIQGTW
jgi:hypothetical protein